LWTLDALRGACAGVVFLSHWHLWSDFAPQGAIETAVRRAFDGVYEAFVIGTWPLGGHHPAVLGFFVLSGFCIHFPFEWRLRHGGGAPSWREYFRRRFLRIMPVYWGACLLGLAFVALECARPGGLPLLTLHAAAPAAHVAVRLAGVSGVYPDEIFAGNYLLNTVAVEMLMYAAYPLIHRFAARGAWRALGAVFLGLHLAAIALLPWVTPFWVFNSVLMLGLFWYAGALAAHLYVTRGWTVRSRTVGLAWAAFLGVKLIPHFYGLNLVKQAAWVVVCVLGLVWALRRETDRADVSHRPLIRALRWTGRVSYSLYAVHTPAIMLATWALLVFAGCRDYFWQLAATLAASIVATLAMHYGVERRFYRPRDA
jgi:peptidoglycan/LPS O-acetylase OafA/YrhL